MKVEVPDELKADVSPSKRDKTLAATPIAAAAGLAVIILSVYVYLFV